MDDFGVLPSFPLAAASPMPVGALLFGFLHLEYWAGWLRVPLHPLYPFVSPSGLGYVAFLAARAFAADDARRDQVLQRSR
jgi:hypothetical protein